MQLPYHIFLYFYEIWPYYPSRACANPLDFPLVHHNKAISAIVKFANFIFYKALWPIGICIFRLFSEYFLMAVSVSQNPVDFIEGICRLLSAKKIYNCSTIDGFWAKIGSIIFCCFNYIIVGKSIPKILSIACYAITVPRH